MLPWLFFALIGAPLAIKSAATSRVGAKCSGVLLFLSFADAEAPYKNDSHTWNELHFPKDDLSMSAVRNKLHS